MDHLVTPESEEQDCEPAALGISTLSRTGAKENGHGGVTERPMLERTLKAHLTDPQIKGGSGWRQRSNVGGT